MLHALTFFAAGLIGGLTGISSYKLTGRFLKRH